MKSKIIASTLLGIGFLIGASALSALADWTAPVAAPPTCTAGSPGCDAPIHVGSTLQKKLGSLQLNTALPTANAVGLEVWGLSKFYGGIQIALGAGANKVLTSDAAGNASWATAAGGFSNFKSVSLSAFGELKSVTTTYLATNSICVMSDLNNGGCDTGTNAYLTTTPENYYKINLHAVSDCDQSATVTYLCMNTGTTQASPVTMPVTINEWSVDDVDVPRGQTVTYTLNFSGGPLDSSYNIFVHLVDWTTGMHVANIGDIAPSPSTNNWTGGNFSVTKTWTANVAPGTYKVVAGLYNGSGNKTGILNGTGVTNLSVDSTKHDISSNSQNAFWVR